MFTNYCIKYYSANDALGSNSHINAANCEYYFMLYIDNELTTTERAAVEEFLVAQPSYTALLDSLRLARLPIQQHPIAKEQLYKTTNITIENYESYVLLQIDDALTEEETTKLGAFLATNPSLAANAALLQRTKLVPEDTIPFNKTTLLKPTADLLKNTNSVAEALSLYLDNEATIPQRQAIDELAKNDIIVANELALLQRTKLLGDTISFPNKHILYKKETKVRPLAPYWLHIAAAACVVGVVLFFAFNQSGEESSSTPTVVTKQTIVDTVTRSLVQNDQFSNTSKNVLDATKNENELPMSTSKNPPLESLSRINGSREVREAVSVKNPLNENNTVTKNNTIRITNDNDVAQQQTVLTNNEVTTNASPITTTLSSIKNNATAAAVALGTPLHTLPKQNSTIPTALLDANTESTVSIMHIDAAKLDKQGKVKKARRRIGTFLQEKLGTITNTSISIGKYEIALVQPR